MATVTEAAAATGTIVVIERYWDSHDQTWRHHYGCDSCRTPVHWMNASLGDPHICPPPKDQPPVQHAGHLMEGTTP